MACSLVAAGLSILLVSCDSQKSAGLSKSPAKGEVGITFQGYSNKDGTGWHAIVAVENRSPNTLQCLTYSRAAGLESGAEAEVAESLDVSEMPHDVKWVAGDPDSMPPKMMKRYGMGQFFVLQPGEKRDVGLAIRVPDAHPEKFTEHLVIGYRRADTGEYDYYIAELQSP